MPKPNVFIVGAPKCGTTALNQYLGQHPDIFIPKDKDKRFFGLDLHMISRLTEEQFVNRFDKADTPVIVDATVYSLLSKTAASEIKLFSPDAKIIIMLRNPLEMLYAHHAQLVFNGLGEDEPLTDFAEAWQAECLRRVGHQIPPETRVLEALYYRVLADYTPQVSRYYGMFGASAVQVVFYDDFKRDAEAATRAIFGFLELEYDLALDTPVINPNTVVRYPLIRWVIAHIPRGFKVLFPKTLRGIFRLVVGRINTKVSPRSEMDATLRRDIAAYFAPRTPALATLLGQTIPWAEALLEASQDVDEIGREH
jgi:hypothetical protein